MQEIQSRTRKYRYWEVVSTWALSKSPKLKSNTEGYPWIMNLKSGYSRENPGNQVQPQKIPRPKWVKHIAPRINGYWG